MSPRHQNSNADILTPVPLNGAVSGERVFRDVTKVKGSHKGGPSFNMSDRVGEGVGMSRRKKLAWLESP